MPTTEVGEFLVAAEAAQRRRRRWWLVGTAVLLVAVLVATTLLVAAKRRADADARVQLADQLRAAAASEKDPGLALRLQLSALAVQPSAVRRDAVAHDVLNSHLRRVLPAAEGPVRGVAYSSDDSVLVTTSRDGGIRTFGDDDTGARSVERTRGLRCGPATGGGIVAYGDDGTVGDESDVVIGRPAPGGVGVLARTPVEHATPACPSLSRDAAALVAVPGGAPRAAPLAGPTTPFPSSIALAGTHVTLGDLAGHVDLLDLSDPVPRALGSAALDGALPVGSMELTTDASMLAVGGAEGPGGLWRVGRGLEPVDRLDVADFGFAERALFSPDGRRVAVGGNDGNVALYDVLPNGLARTGHVPGEGPPEDRARVSSLSWSPDGSTVAIGSDAGLRLVRVDGPAVSTTVPGVGATLATAMPTGTSLLLTWSRGQLGLWDLETGSPALVGAWSGGPTDASSVHFSGDGRWVGAATLQDWSVRDLASMVDTGRDPVPAACLAVVNVPLPQDLAARMADLKVVPPC